MVLPCKKPFLILIISLASNLIAMGKYIFLEAELRALLFSQRSLFLSVLKLNSGIIQNSNIGSGESITFHFPGYGALIQILRVSHNIYCLFAVDYWSTSIKIISGSFPDGVVVTKGQNETSFTCTNNATTNSAISILVL